MKLSVKKIIIGLCAALLIAALAVPGFLFRYYPRYLNARETYDIAQVEWAEGEHTVMTFNIRRSDIWEPGKRNWYYRANLAAKSIAEIAPDIIGFQEAKEMQYMYLLDSLFGYESVNRYRDESKDPESCPIFYRADRYELMYCNSFWLSESPMYVSKDWDSGCYRVCVYAILQERASGREFAVFNTHLDHVSEKARVKGMQLILAWMEQQGGIPVILIGDMNMTDDAEPYRLATEGLFDARRRAKDTMEMHTYNDWGASADGSRIDYIFASKEFSASKYWVETKTYDGVYTSDHFPACALLELK